MAESVMENIKTNKIRMKGTYEKLLKLNFKDQDDMCIRIDTLFQKQMKDEAEKSRREYA